MAFWWPTCKGLRSQDSNTKLRNKNYANNKIQNRAGNKKISFR